MSKRLQTEELDYVCAQNAAKLAQRNYQILRRAEPPDEERLLRAKEAVARTREKLKATSDRLNQLGLDKGSI
jgi:hypothetical protein